MSGNAIKAYVYLLCGSWLEIPRATLPMDRDSLASMARLSGEKWDEIKDEVMQHFKEGQCKEHKGRYYNDTLLEISRKWENNQRLNNKNAKRTRIKHGMNTALDNDNAIDNDINSSHNSGGGAGEEKQVDIYKEFSKAYPQNMSTVSPTAEQWFFREIASGESVPEIIAGAIAYANYWKSKEPEKYPYCRFIMQAEHWLEKKMYKIDWAKKLDADFLERVERGDIPPKQRIPQRTAIDDVNDNFNPEIHGVI